MTVSKPYTVRGEMPGACYVELSAGTSEEAQRLVTQLKAQSWPNVSITTAARATATARDPQAALRLKRKAKSLVNMGS